MPQAPRHSDNPPGDFYVERDCCLACDAPVQEAPDLMGAPYSSARDSGCFFRKQPSTSDETDRACSAVSVSCVKAVRYAGDDPDILRKVYESGSYESCDHSRRPRTPDEEAVAASFRRMKRRFKKLSIHWTYTVAQEPQRVVVALCYEPDFLAIFSMDRSTHEVSLVKDDAKYRPQFDTYKRPNLKSKKT